MYVVYCHVRYVLKVLIVFLQLPDVVRVNRLTRSDGFLTIIKKRFPSLHKWTDRFINLIAFIFMLAVAVAIWPDFLEMLETKDFFGVPGIFTAPWWPIKLVIFLSASLCSILFALKLLLPPVDKLPIDTLPAQPAETMEPTKQ